MEKLVFVAVIWVTMISVSFADEPKAARKDFELRGQAGSIVVGNLKAVLPSDLSRPETGLVVTDENGKEISFTVKPLAVIYSAVDGTLMSVKEISPGSRVQVSYSTTPQGRLRAAAVKVMGKAAEGETRPARPKVQEEAIK